jgi:outer membrane protein assembly factor BamB
VIPVLVGDAKMPRPEDLPALLAELAHLNAIEIFDQLYRDSIRNLITALRPLVYPRRRVWPWTSMDPARRRLLVLGIVLLVLVGTGTVVAILTPSSDRSSTPDAAQPGTEALFGLDDSGSTPARVKVGTPPDITQLPSIVEASRTVALPGDPYQGTGPLKPHVVWRARVTVGDAWHVVGIAADGTVYLYDEEHSTLDAIRDGKEQWAYSTPGPLGFARDGRLWLGNYIFNSRGEGGKVARKDLLSDRATLQLAGARDQDHYSCRGGQVFSLDSRGKRSWTVDIDGNCGSQTPPLGQSGTIYSSSDARTLYAISRDGRVLWTVPQACKKGDVTVYPLPPNDLIVTCNDQPLYSLHDGKPGWTAMVGAAKGWFWSGILTDGSGNVYVGAEGPSIKGELIALDKSGKQIWNVSAGSSFKLSPVGFDAQGRLYVSDSERIVCLSK